MKFNTRPLAVMVLFLLLSLLGHSQSPVSTKQNGVPAEPKWVKMMHDPNANYFETLKAFRKFWKHRSLPREPFESEELEVFEKEVGLTGEKESEEERERELKKMKNKKAGEYDYALEVKEFKGWMQRVKPWVKEDGTILSEEEQQKLINRQQAELKEIEKKNGKN